LYSIIIGIVAVHMLCHWWIELPQYGKGNKANSLIVQLPQEEQGNLKVTIDESR